MAADTIGADISMIKIGGRPGISGVANFTVIGTGDMITVFACCNRAIMTSKTGAVDFCMVNSDNWRPAGISMTAFAIVTGVYMGRVFSCCNCPIMAVTAIFTNIGMAENGICPPRSFVTITAIFVAGYMVCGLTNGGTTVMTGIAVAYNGCVIYFGNLVPGSRGMAVFAKAG